MSLKESSRKRIFGGQAQRAYTITRIQEWINETGDLKLFTMEKEMEIKRRAMLTFGLTRQKTEEYLDLILGRD